MKTILKALSVSLCLCGSSIANEYAYLQFPNGQIIKMPTRGKSPEKLARRYGASITTAEAYTPPAPVTGSVTLLIPSARLAREVSADGVKYNYTLYRFWTIAPTLTDDIRTDGGAVTITLSAEAYNSLKSGTQKALAPYKQ